MFFILFLERDCAVFDEVIRCAHTCPSSAGELLHGDPQSFHRVFTLVIANGIVSQSFSLWDLIFLGVT